MTAIGVAKEMTQRLVTYLLHNHFVFRLTDFVFRLRFNDILGKELKNNVFTVNTRDDKRTLKSRSNFTPSRTTFLGLCC